MALLWSPSPVQSVSMIPHQDSVHSGSPAQLLRLCASGCCRMSCEWILQGLSFCDRPPLRSITSVGWGGHPCPSSLPPCRTAGWRLHSGHCGSCCGKSAQIIFLLGVSAVGGGGSHGIRELVYTLLWALLSGRLRSACPLRCLSRSPCLSVCCSLGCRSMFLCGIQHGGGRFSG